MLFYSALFVCFLTILAFDNKEVKKTEPQKPETIFADVIKNISRVNNVLQDLINNYEQLQKVYKSQENFDGPDYSSERDNDHSSQNTKKSKRASLTTATPYMFYQAGTRMILSDTDVDNTAKVDTPVTKKTTVFDPMALSDSSDIEDTIEADVKRLKELETSRTPKSVDITTTAKNKLQTRQPPKDSKKDKTKEAKDLKIIFASIPKKVKTKIDSKTKIMPESVQKLSVVDTNSMKLKDALNSNSRPQNGHDGNISKPKLNKLHAYSIGSTGKQVNLQIKISENPENPKDVENIKTVEKQRNTEKETNQQNSEKQETPRNVEKTRTVKKVTIMEDSNDSDNQGNYATPRNGNADNINKSDNPSNRESQREAGNPANKEAIKRPGNQNRPLYSKEVTASEEKYSLSDDDSAIHINTNSKTKTTNYIAVSQIDSATLRSHVDNISASITKDNKKMQDLSDDDDDLTKDMFKTSVLRQAYGDACLKLVVRKCHRACKSAYVTSCRTLECKSDLKEMFERSSRTGCIKEFVANEDDPKKHAFRIGKSPDGPHVDITREGYLSVACQPQTVTGLPALRRNLASNKGTIIANNSMGNDIELNILRDRYEKACQRLSRGKCTTACNYAHNATCVKFECEKRLKKSFRRNCKAHCKRAYSSTSKKQKGSDSDGDSDDSGSDDSSESDDD
ncbi:unnamed protein product [Spodoptera littoralis]|uniref:Uncharacterized protein n=1 Tax=Spodoptera littoralis TaxID=7109 RepID=A0A9P0N2F1_SPOLI|nr:unnamed protein product [Spodoptera littoralis]CAH1642166.1 unnamed protein product [Spodoptera littoralis]